MKKILFSSVILLIVSVLCSSNMFSRSLATNKGSNMFSGGITFSSAGGELYEVDGDRISTLQVSASYGYFFLSGFSVGLNLNYTSISQGGESISEFGIGPEILYFFGKPKLMSSAKGSIFPYLGIAFTYNSYKLVETMTGTQFDFKGGICYMISNTVGVFFEPAYVIQKYTYEGISTNGNMIKVVIGFKIFL